MHEITLWQIIIVTLYAVLFWWVNGLEMNDSTSERDVKCIQNGLLGRMRWGWYDRVKRSMGMKV
jgi:hypothetical protein